MRFQALDAWRGLAAIIVALFHLRAAGLFYDIPVIRHGGIGVPLFFVLSGFVISHAYAQRLRTRSEARAFVVRRFGRLYPLHIFSLILLVGLELLKLVISRAGGGFGQDPFSETTSLDKLMAHLFLMQAIIPFGHFGWNGPSWSISVEWFAYLTFAATMVAGNQRAEVWGSVLCLLFGAMILAHDLSGLAIDLMKGRGLLMGLFGFFLGGLVRRAYGILRAKGWQGGTLSESIAAVIVVCLFWFEPPGDFVTVVGFAIVILIFAFQGGALSGWLMTGVPQFLGRISYSIYLLHFVVLSVIYGGVWAAQSATGRPLMVDERIDFGPAAAMDALAIAYLASVILAAWLTYNWVESPGRAFFNTLSDRGTVRQAWRAATDDVRPQAAH